jgi:outer membrane protein
LARQALLAAQEGAGAATAAFMPRIYLRGAAGRADGSNILTGWQEGVGLHFETPLYTGGKLTGERRTAEAEPRGTLADAQAILDGISLGVSLAYRRVVAAGELFELSRVAVVEAEEGLRLMRVKYRNGDAILTDLVDVETSRTRAQQNFYLALYAQLAALAQLNYALALSQAEFFETAAASPETEMPGPEEPPRLQPLPELK